ncbi:hypothetical protein MAGR_69220 [Mycolicibacterium agri]|uniref:AbiEi antitoxin C-terminal domain-containing protein n=1 Tax=Mycolicibacterium agri TaxID=36811 RepID=A0A7I9WCM1_MYCAG|nr:hypothetical protein MAGR_69220 [Mycolicibacterium agri]
MSRRYSSAHLWARGEAVVSGLAASALYGAKWIDDDSPVELIWAKTRSPDGVITRNELLLDDEIQQLNGFVVTTPERTAFDLGRRGRIDDAIARLDALARATQLKVAAVEDIAARHPHTRGLRQLEAALDLVDAGAESPKETWLRLLVIRDGYPRPQTQIPVRSPDGRRRYYLDMGWPDLMLAIEYEGDHHRTSRELRIRDHARRRHSRGGVVGDTCCRAKPPDRSASAASTGMGFSYGGPLTR